MQPRVSEVQETEEITEIPAPTAKKNKKEREKEKLSVETVDLKSPVPSQTHVAADGIEGLDKMMVSEPIPNIWLSVQNNKHLSGFQMIRSMTLPSPEEVLSQYSCLTSNLFIFV